MLCRNCLELETANVGAMISMCEEIFPLSAGTLAASRPRPELRSAGDKPPLRVKTAGELIKLAGQAAKRLLTSYIDVQGRELTQMIRKSMEARDWLGTTEPRSVRMVIKSLVDDVAAIDLAVSQLFENEPQRPRSSESARRAVKIEPRLNDRFDPNLVHNIQKLFGERIYVHAVVDFTRQSIITGIIMGLLKVRAALRRG